MRDQGQGYRLLAGSHALPGHRKEARHYAKQVLIEQPGFSLEHWRNIPPDRNPEPRERYLEGYARRA